MTNQKEAQKLYAERVARINKMLERMADFGKESFDIKNPTWGDAEWAYDLEKGLKEIHDNLFQTGEYAA